jgi:hypothetical protein
VRALLMGEVRMMMTPHLMVSPSPCLSLQGPMRGGEAHTLVVRVYNEPAVLAARIASIITSTETTVTRTLTLVQKVAAAAPTDPKSSGFTAQGKRKKTPKGQHEKSNSKAAKTSRGDDSDASSDT